MNIATTSNKDRHYLLTGLKPKQEVLEYYKRLQKELCINVKDPVWLYIILMQHFSDNFLRLPENVAQQCADAIQGAKKASQEVVSASALDLKTQLIETLREKTDEIAKAAEEQANMDKAQTITVCGIVLLILLTLTFWAGLHFGEGIGHAAGLREATNIEMAGTWGATEAGQKAYQMYLSGDLDSVMSCKQPGWIVKKGECFPYPAKNGQYGWRLPQ